ncbi:hypothetical protein AZ20_4234 [Bordetella bronchiseptica E014]|uniref:hypothetical protein n=1 Tax=Bordetella bronchiseptica TaxID=518 RepID=UPI0004A03998|nr:hypothetical protein [Bordetella bronchiseptica]KDC22947.1 hypothetical protein AZ20_4234 [Bordetella bronchiseptica E014]
MTTQNHAAQAELQDINAIIAKHFGDDTAGAVRAQITVNEVLSKLRAPVADTLPLEKALYELVNKIDTGLDTGDLLQDARCASTVLDAIMTGGDLVACAYTFFKECGEDKWRERYERSLDFRIGWNACLDAIAEAQANRAALASAPTPDERTDDAMTLLGKYKALCIEIGRGDSYHLGRIDAAIAALASVPVAGEAQPSDDELEALADQHTEGCHPTTVYGHLNTLKFARALLSRYAAPQASAMDFTGAYEGAREDLAIWKRRALEAERDLRAERETSSRLAAAVNGPTHMGEPAPQASAVAVPRGIIDAARQAGFAFLRHADGSYSMQPIKMATAQAEDSAKGVGADVALPPLPHPTAHRRHAMFAGSQMTSYAKEAVLADRQQRAGDADRWRWATAIDENAQTLHSIVLCHGGDQQKINERADFYRAALAARKEAL